MKQTQPLGISHRIILIGTILIPINCFWLVLSRQPYQYQTIHTIISPFFNVVFIVFVLALFNRPMTKFAPRLSLTHGELIIIYIMLSLTSAIQSFQMMQTLVPVMEYPFRVASPENDWQNLFARYIPPWLSVSDKGVLQTYFRGESTLYVEQHIQPWLIPALCWSAFVVMLVLVMGAIAVLFKRPWVENERLSYPIIQLPLELTNPRTPVLKSRLLWLGFGISGGIALINGLSSLYPVVPRLRIHPYENELSNLFTTKPWSTIGSLQLGLVFSVIGLAFFMPLDMSFSCAFFFFLMKVQRVIAEMLGARHVAYTGYLVSLNQQSFGALVGMAVIAIWVNRKYFRVMFRRVSGVDSDEQSNYRKAVLTIVLGIGFMTLFLWKAGMAIWLSLSFFLLYYLVSLGLTRFRAEMGVPMHDFHFTGPDQMLPDVFGARRIGYRNLTVMSMLGFFNFTYRGHPQPHQMEGLAMLDRAGVGNKRIFLAMTAALVVGTLSLFWVYLHVAYSSGGSSLQRYADVIYTRVADWIAYPSKKIEVSGIQTIGIGFGVSIFLIAMRQRFLWWRLHPGGYAIANSLDIDRFWFSMFIGFAMKWLLIRYGGVGQYRRARPLFLGLILGEYIVGSVWTIIGDIMHRFIFFGGTW